MAYAVNLKHDASQWLRARCTTHCSELGLLAGTQVRTRFGEASLEMWAIGQRAYQLHVPKLYGTIVPSKCKLRIRPCKITLQLQKTSDAEWRFLKG